jgi:hypothetical protein
MGGIGSGRRWGSEGKTTVEQVRAIDVNRWHREGWLRSGLLFAWQWTYADGRRAVINAEARLDEVVLRYRVRETGGEWENVQEAIPLERTPCGLGGVRPCFRCPRCRQRSRKLYGAGKLFLCRRCYNLGYECQREKRGDRALRRASRIRQRLGGGPGIAEPFPWKPKGMHWQTYERWRAKALEAELESLRAISLWVDRLLGKRTL